MLHWLDIKIEREKRDIAKLEKQMDGDFPIVPALRRFPGSPGIQKGFDVPYRGHFSASSFFSRAAMSSGSVPQSASSRLRCR